MTVLMKIYLYSAISLSWLAIGILYLFKWAKFHRRVTDRDFGILFALCSVSFALYGIESSWTPSAPMQIVTDLLIFLVSTLVFIRSVRRDLHYGENP